MQCITQIFITLRLIEIYKCKKLNKKLSILTLILPSQPQYHKTKIKLDNQTDIEDRNIL